MVDTTWNHFSLAYPANPKIEWFLNFLIEILIHKKNSAPIKINIRYLEASIQKYNYKVVANCKTEWFDFT